MGIGTRPMHALIGTAKDKGEGRFEGGVHLEKEAMLSLVKRPGFAIEPIFGQEQIVRAVMPLRQI